MKVIHSIFFVCYMWMNIAQLFSFTYPVREVRLTSFFGESRGDHFHGGMDFGIRQVVFPLGAGELLFIKDDRDPRDFPAGVGNAVIIEHPGKLRSYYYHLEQGSFFQELLEETGAVTENTAIGIIGDSGYSLGVHLHLDIEDIERKLLLNPLNLLDRGSLNQDTIPPVINSFFFKINEKLYSLKKRQSRFSYRGPLEIYAVAMDYLSREDRQLGRRVGVAEFSLTIDGEVFRQYNFKHLKKSEKGLVLEGEIVFAEVYGLPFNYKFGTFTPTQASHVFELYVRDHWGNEKRETYTVFFQS